MQNKRRLQRMQKYKHIHTPEPRKQITDPARRESDTM